MEKHTGIIKVGFFGKMHFFSQFNKTLSTSSFTHKLIYECKQIMRLQYFFNPQFVVKVDSLISLMSQQKLIPFDSVETSCLICFCFSLIVLLNSLLDFSFASLIEIK